MIRKIFTNLGEASAFMQCLLSKDHDFCWEPSPEGYPVVSIFEDGDYVNLINNKELEPCR